jgi:hypothetical protein
MWEILLQGDIVSTPRDAVLQRAWFFIPTTQTSSFLCGRIWQAMYCVIGWCLLTCQPPFYWFLLSPYFPSHICWPPFPPNSWFLPTPWGLGHHRGKAYHLGTSYYCMEITVASPKKTVTQIHFRYPNWVWKSPWYGRGAFGCGPIQGVWYMYLPINPKPISDVPPSIVHSTGVSWLLTFGTETNYIFM